MLRFVLSRALWDTPCEVNAYLHVSVTSLSHEASHAASGAKTDGTFEYDEKLVEFSGHCSTGSGSLSSQKCCKLAKSDGPGHIKGIRSRLAAIGFAVKHRNALGNCWK